MSDPRGSYLDQQRKQGFLAPGGIMANLPGVFTRLLAPLAKRIAGGVTDFNLGQLPPEIQAFMPKATQAVQTLGPDFDYARLAQLAEDHADKLPPEVYGSMAATAALGRAHQ